MPSLILRPVDSKEPTGKQRLQVRYHESVGGATEYDTIATVTFEMARTITSCGEAYFLFGDPYLRKDKGVSELEEPDMSDMYLLIKRGLYYCPNYAGYVGVKDMAGIYNKEKAEKVCNMNDDVSMVKYNDAADYSPKCFEDIKTRHQQQKSMMGLLR